MMRAERGRQAEKKQTVRATKGVQAQQKDHNANAAVRSDDVQTLERQPNTVSGPGSWKRWIPRALLRCMFAPPATKDDAQGARFRASHTHCKNIRYAGADILDQQLADDIYATTIKPNLVMIHQMQCDETHFTVQCADKSKPSSKSIFGSHGLYTTCKSLDHTVQDKQEVMPPRALEDQTADTMFNALVRNSKLPVVLPESCARYRGLTLASDHAMAMQRLQAHVEDLSVAGKQFFLKVYIIFILSAMIINN